MIGRRTIPVLLLGLMVSPVFGQTASMLSFQGLIKDASGNPITGDVVLEFRIYDAKVGGNLVDMNGDGKVSEATGDVQSVDVEATDGIVATKFGPVSPKAFDGNLRWLEVRVNGSALSRVEMATAWATAEQLNIPGTGQVALSVSPSGLEVTGDIQALGKVAAQAYGTNTSTSTVATGLCDPHRLGVCNPNIFDECARFDPKCNFGIGEQNPQAKLHIGGTPNVDGIMFPNGSLQTTAWTGGGSSFWTDNGNDISNTNIGDVGVGTSLPLAKLHVEGNDQSLAQTALASDDVVVEASDAVLGLYSTDGGDWGSALTLGEIDGGGNLVDKWTMARRTMGGGSSLRFTFGSNANFAANPTVMTLSDDGNVAIKARLDVSHDLFSNAIFANGSVRISKGLNQPGTGLKVVRQTRGGKLVDYRWTEIDGNKIDGFGGFEPGSADLILNGTSTGNVGIGTDSPNAKLHIANDARGEDLGVLITGSNPDSDGGGLLVLHNNAGNAIRAFNTGTGRGGYFFSNQGTGLQVTSLQGWGLEVSSSGANAALVARHSGSNTTGYFENTGTAGVAGQFEIKNTANGNIALYCKTTGTGYAFAAEGRAWVKVLEIAGADLAEKFPASEDLKPGMVVEIDPNHAGKLRISREAYNRRVAGVVSGAGGLPTGAILGNLSGLEDAPPIALSGRVWVNCDAGAHAIEPGDLLTTSATPGHAMKVTHYSRAYGAVIGKAMTNLAEGERGLVLVLVSLQ